ncbi:hypothetical protein GOBAR_DD24779 [Gossypium barbadense]|nr:hypothetical protein GOBAR_DD24779 [Gossypium barbadense]
MGTHKKQFHQHQVVGKALPTENDEHPKIYRMKLWAINEVRAKSKFWYFLRKLKKVKKSNGQVLAINEGMPINSRLQYTEASPKTICEWAEVRVIATVMVLPSPETSGRLLLLLNSIGEITETSSSKRAKKKSSYNVGSLVVKN